MAETPDERDAEPGGDNGDEQATAVEVPQPREPADATQETQISQSAASSGSSPLSDAGGTTTTTSPADALHLEEVARTRIFISAGWILGAIVLVALPVMAGNTTVKWIFGGSIAVNVAIGVWLHQRFRDPTRFNHRSVTTLAITSVTVVFLGILYLGIFSIGPIVIVLGLYFFARSESLGSAFLVLLYILAVQGALAALILSGAVPDPGLLPHGDQPLHDLALIQLFVEIIYVTTYLMARKTRETTLAAIENLQDAMRQVARRDALLQEARDEIDRARQIGGPGMFTDRTFGSYRLGAVIGRGAMGEVYEAAHEQTGESAAVKLLHPHILGDPRQVARFLREARVVSALRSPHVVRVQEASDPLDPLPYLAMERLYGHDLAHHLRKGRSLSSRRLIELMRQIGSVIDAASEQGIVHRDLKPHNLFLAEQPDGSSVWKVLDFGVSVLGDQGGTLTQGHVVGTPSYMAPEQATSGRVDSRTDLYALAAIGYRWLTGRAPFTGRDIPSLLYEVVHTMPVRPSALADVPPDVDDVLAIGLAKKAEDRFETGQQLADAFAAALHGSLDETLRRRAAARLDVSPWATI